MRVVVQTWQQFSSVLPYQEPSRHQQSHERYSAQNHHQQKVGIFAVFQSVNDFLSFAHSRLDASQHQGK